MTKFINYVSPGYIGFPSRYYYNCYDMCNINIIISILSDFKLLCGTPYPNCAITSSTSRQGQYVVSSTLALL